MKRRRADLDGALESRASGKSPRFSSSNAAWLLQNPHERYNSSESMPKKEIPIRGNRC